MVTRCEACGSPVNEVAFSCPHCGEKRERGAVTYSKDELQALLDTDHTIRNGGRFSLFSSLVLPHKHTRGLARVLELVLTGFTLPAVAVGAIGMALLGARRRSAGYSTSGELAPVVVMTLLGGSSILMWLGLRYALIAITAMWARSAVRMLSSGQHERAEILKASRPATPAPARLPMARLVATAPAPVVATAPAPVVATAPVVAAPAVTAPAVTAPAATSPAATKAEPGRPSDVAPDAGDGPSILR